MTETSGDSQQPRSDEPFAFDPTNPVASLASFPKEFREFIAGGFRLAIGKSPDQIGQALAEIARDVSSAPDFAVITNAVGTAPGNETRNFAGAMSLYMLVANAVGVDQALPIFRTADFLSADDVAALKDLPVAYQRHQDLIQRRFVEQETATKVLPNLTSIKWTVDLRPTFQPNREPLLVPVAIVDLMSDLQPHRLLCQLSAAEVDRLIRTFEQIRARMTRLSKIAEIKVPAQK